jgi:hypothetical protein
MNRITCAVAVLGVLAVAVLMLAWHERESFSQTATEVSCAYYSGNCLRPGIFSGMSFRLFP